MTIGFVCVCVYDIPLMPSWYLNVLRDPAGPAGQETAQSVQCQEGPQALAAPLHPGQQPLPGGHQEALPASDRRGLSEWKPPPQQQGGRGGCQQLNARMWPHKEGSLFVRTYCRCVCIRPNKCTYSSVPYVEMFSEPSLSGDRVFTSCPPLVCAWGLTGLTGTPALWRWLPAQTRSLISHSILFWDSSSLLHVPAGRFITFFFLLCYYHIVQIMQVYSYLN